MFEPNATPTTQHDRMRVVTLCYRYAYLRQRHAHDTLNRAERIIWGVLQRTLEGDAGGKRGHRRMRLGARAVIRLRGIDVPGTVRDISGGGMFFECAVKLPVGSRIEVRIGQGSETEYVFGCLIERHGNGGLGLSYRSAPLELRHGLRSAA